MSSTPTRHRFTRIPVLATAGIPTLSAGELPIPETPLKRSGTTRIPVPVTPQRQAPGVASPGVNAQGPPRKEKNPTFVQPAGELGILVTSKQTPGTRIPVAVTPQKHGQYTANIQDANTASTKKTAFTFKPIPPLGVLRSVFTSTEANETFTSSAVNPAQSLETTTVHRKYESFEEYVAVDKKHGRNEELVDGMTINNKYRRIEDSGSYNYTTRLPVPSSYTIFKAPMSASYDPRDGYTADMAKTPARRFPGQHLGGSGGANVETATVDLHNGYYSALSAPPPTRGNRLSKMAKPSKARNAAMSTMKTANATPATPQMTRGGGISMPGKKTMTSFNSSAGFGSGTNKWQPLCPSTPKSTPVTPAMNISISPCQLPAPLMPVIHVPRTPDFKFTTPTQSAPVAYDKIPQKVTVINGMKRSVGHDERFPILRRVRKNQPQCDEGTRSTAVTPDAMAGSLDQDVVMADD